MLFANPDDLLGLSDNDKIVLVTSGGGLRQDPVEHMDELGRYLAARTKVIKPRYEHSATYDLMDEDGLELNFGVLVATMYMLTGLSVVQDPGGKPVRATVNFIKLSNVNHFNLANAVAFDIAVLGGFGIVDAYGCEIASPGDITEANMRVDTQNASVMHRTSGDFQEAGYVIFGGKITYGISATGAITLPSGNNYRNTGDEKRGQSEIRTFAENWIGYPAYI
jgi:hypothetical protein